eukprot:TRINITY_DN36047_c0_g1_i1.p1 TRINITY_DN36047_c0_g1~~TRINITY_DN36047_c0_g1_i1.p1  ORF type:complete len:722 (+),score=110.69 TRINITY_DN36047_c0_g1_i1:42-2207(+)
MALAGTGGLDSPAHASAAQPSAPSNGSGPKVVGPNVQGSREEYQLIMHLQSALFGGVYEARGRTSGREFAIKVLHKSELQKAEESNSIEFCEVPLSEIEFAEVMRGCEHVMEVEEHFEDAYCHYCVFQLCRGGDLLEALKKMPTGFEEAQVQYFMKQACIGIQFLHRRGVAMQDVSLENMLLNAHPKTGNWEVKICDPGQAVRYSLDQTGQEMLVAFRGLVGKSFRPPELHDQKPYLATKVDSWCLGWSAFYLLTAQPLFMSADPQQSDADWMMFKNGKVHELFKSKSADCSELGRDFMLKLLRLDPRKRMSIADACNHPWLADERIPPVPATKADDKESKRRTSGASVSKASTAAPREFLPGMPSGSSVSSSGPTGFSAAVAPGTGSSRRAGLDLPTWSSAPLQGTAPVGQHPMSPMARVRSPMRSPQQNAAAQVPAAALPVDRRSRRLAPHPGAAVRNVVATAHSPAPAGLGGAVSAGLTWGGGYHRASSPVQHQQRLVAAQQAGIQTVGLDGYGVYQKRAPNFMATPRTSLQYARGASPGNGIASASQLLDGHGPAWTFGGREAAQASDMYKRMGSEDASEFGAGRRTLSPGPGLMSNGAPRALSPPHMAPTANFANVAQGQHLQNPQRAMYLTRSASPVQHIRNSSPGVAARSAGLNWSSIGGQQGAVTMGTAATRTASPPGGMPSYPTSPGTLNRAFSPSSPHARGMMMSSLRAGR